MATPEPEKTGLVPDEELAGLEGTIGAIRVEAGPAFSARTRLKVRGLNVESSDKEKVSLTLDRTLVAELRARAADLPLSAVVNELLHEALTRDRLRSLVERLEAEAGPAPPESYERVLDQWFRDDGE